MLRSQLHRAAASLGGFAGAGAADVIPFRFVASDMDGTVLSPRHTLSEYTAETLRRLTQDRRVPFIFATGRVYADVAAINHHLQRYFVERRQALPPASATTWARTPSYIITSNGAVAHDAESGTMMLEHAIDPQFIRELYHLLPPSETRINTGMIQGDKWFCRMNWEEMLKFHKESGYRYQVLETIPEVSKNHHGTDAGDTSAAEGALQHVHKIFFSCWDRPLLEKLESVLQRRYGDLLTVTFSASYNVDITAKGVTKAAALQQLFEKMAPLPHETSESDLVAQRLKATVAFGDDLNDAAMLSAVGCGFIMGNCNPQLKVRCPQLEVIDTNAEDAVARKLREVFHLE